MIKLSKIVAEIAREQMPQIGGDNFSGMLRLFRTNEIPYRMANIRVGNLKTIQDTAIPEKVDNIATDIVGGDRMSPIIISQDMCIADGNHRFLAYKKLYGDNYGIDVCIVDYPIQKLLKLLGNPVVCLSILPVRFEAYLSLYLLLPNLPICSLETGFLEASCL